MIQEYLEFLKNLKTNNNREWFHANKSQYTQLQSQYLIWIQEILDTLTQSDPALQLLTSKDCVFRINRDIRFTNDKSPYKTKLCGMFSPTIRNGEDCGYYFEISCDGQLMVGGGRYFLGTKDLLKARQSISENSTKFRVVLDNPLFKKTFGNMSGDKLKTHPRGFDPQDPNIDLLKFKNYIAMTNFDIKKMSDDKIKNIILTNLRAVQPLVECIRNF